MSVAWEQKIAAYADQRAAPHTVAPLTERLLEAKERYKDRPGTSMNNPRIDLLIAYAQTIERQIFAHLPFPPKQITTRSANKYRPALETELFKNPKVTLS